ncbi:hypothetical protein [Lampropedia aestuarii]|uniref:hypothetical protein n=1 Tax=Lampropedia aestuarii TaxID=2562762 RepID=UPI0024697348|nr:hypothetical protein [Lampropedia aestuarii]MDH5857533.1 hypothetical protein [Lampropedia aestuarii]
MIQAQSSQAQSALALARQAGVGRTLAQVADAGGGEFSLLTVHLGRYQADTMPVNLRHVVAAQWLS